MGEGLIDQNVCTCVCVAVSIVHYNAEQEQEKEVNAYAASSMKSSMKNDCSVEAQIKITTTSNYTIIKPANFNILIF